MDKLIIEARINEYAPRVPNPHVPWSPAEIAADARACREAGASIVHFHARKPDGAPETAPSASGAIIRRIRDACDVLVHPTLGSQTKGLTIRERLQPVLDLAADPATRPDILPLCLSSPNWDFFDRQAGGFRGAGQLYLNPTGELIEAITALRGAGIGLSCVCWEIGATRRVLALLEAGILQPPVYLPFHLTDAGMLAGHPGTWEGVAAHLAFLPATAPVTWAVLNLHGSMLPLTDAIVRRGGHVQIGIGDYHYAECGAPTNADLVARVAAIARAAGRETATPDEARRMLGLGGGACASEARP
ncbi:MAG: 3-keto-5-aminohexanoate cleavage protein [Parafilimonas terrae]|nr:3-keto-5-aminohexanoate cleavage protein [Parafilimonas terrae]